MPVALREGSWSGESVLRHRDGHEIAVLQVVLAHRSPGGEVDFLSTIARDISQRKREEEELRRSQTMAALGALVAGVAHEVRNPLFGISSTLDAFEASYSKQQDHRRYVRVLREQLGRLNALATDLLGTANPPRSPRRGRSRRCCRLSGLRADGRAGEVALESGIDRGLPPCGWMEAPFPVFATWSRTPCSTPAGARCASPPGWCGRGRSWVECVVEDSGPGFRAPDLPHVFEPFFTKRKGGTGLGLSIVERIVTDHGGTLAAGNRPEGGARLRVRLPAAPAPETTA
jgi:signal transduction histidine kinase